MITLVFLELLRGVGISSKNYRYIFPFKLARIFDMKIDDLFYLEELLSMKKETGAVESLLRDGGKLTPDLGGNLTADEITGEIIELNVQK